MQHHMPARMHMQRPTLLNPTYHAALLLLPAIRQGSVRVVIPIYIAGHYCLKLLVCQLNRCCCCCCCIAGLLGWCCSKALG